MTFFDILNSIFIEPLKLLFEVIFTISYKVSKSYGLSIVALSFILNILLMPLYKKADELQQEENDIQAKMKPDIDFIKKTFSGNEQYMMLQTYYRQHNYKPVYALRSSISLILQIPFFMAAYSFLSGLRAFENTSFGPISNLAAPDHMLLGINILPVAMTLINMVSSFIYTKGQPLKSKLQLYIMALLFLVLLYNSPSALTFYYLLNNVFSLIKNIINKFENKVRIVSAFGILGCLFLLLKLNPKIFAIHTKVIIYGMLLCAIAFFIFSFAKNEFPRIRLGSFSSNKNVFFFCTLLLFVLTGLLIPSAVIDSSAEEFINTVSFINPVIYIANTAFLSFGLFVFWFNIFYALMEKSAQAICDYFALTACLISLIDYFCFYNGMGTISNTLVYNLSPHFSGKLILLNIVVVLVSFLVVYCILRKKAQVIKNSVLLITIAFVIMSFLNIFNINAQANSTFSKLIQNKGEKNEEQILPLSKNGKNVIVLMLDRGMDYLWPFIIHEKPELLEKFSGFTYYPNAISFGNHTTIGSPALYGGYEYTPEEMNKRDTELLSVKHDEALRVMPFIFSKNGFDTVVCDPPLVGYEWIPDLSIFDDGNIRAYITDGRFSSDVNEYEILNRNLFCYSITKIAPVIIHNIVYDEGDYLRCKSADETEHTSVSFNNAYSALTHLSYMSYLSENETGSFIVMANNTTHEPVYLAEPDYIPSLSIDTSKYKENGQLIKADDGREILLQADYNGQNQIKHYHVNMAAMIQLGNWFDYMRENDVYDNTRIILVSDHGFYLSLNDDLFLDGDDLLRYNAFLMVKDFDSQDYKVDTSFMTNGDTPYLATKDIIENPTNPFTGKKIELVEKKNVEFKVFRSSDTNIETDRGTTFIKNKWFSVHDDCLNPLNWKMIEDPSE